MPTRANRPEVSAESPPWFLISQSLVVLRVKSPVAPDVDQVTVPEGVYSTVPPESVPESVEKLSDAVRANVFVSGVEAPLSRA